MATTSEVSGHSTSLEELRAAGVPAGPVLTLREAVEHEQAAAMGVFRNMGFPGFVGEAPVADLPLEFSAGEAGISTRPPTLGEHNRDILAELGFEASDIDQLSGG